MKTKMSLGRHSFRGIACSLLYFFVPAPHAAVMPRAPIWPPLPELVRVLHYESFDEAYHAGVSNDVVTIPDLATLRASWSGYSLERVGTVTPLIISGLGNTGQVQVTTAQGALRFWFNPYWSSGDGPGVSVTLVELAAVEGAQSASLWSLQANAKGSELQLIGPGGSGVLLATDIAWTAGTWHQMVLNYGTNGTELVLDGEIVAQGSATLAVPNNVARLVIGSSLSGGMAADGELEEVFCFTHPLRLAFHYLPFQSIAALGPVTEEELAYREELMAKWAALKARKTKESEESGGEMMRLLSSPLTDCITNTPLYITNATCAFDASTGWTLAFDVQGTNSPADIFTATNLSDNLTNSSWVWLERGPSCSRYEYTNMPPSQSFVILGTMLDTDSDNLTDAYEKLVSKSVINNPDTDGDGVTDGDEVFVYQTNVHSSDTDGDELPDGWEIEHGTDATTANAAVRFVAEPKATSNIP